MDLDIKKLADILLECAKEINVDVQECSISECEMILKRSEKIRLILEQNLINSIKQSDIDKINNPFVETIIVLFLDEKEINIIYDEEMDIWNEDKRNFCLDSYKLYMRDMARYEVPTWEEEKELLEKYKNGDLESKKELINRNQRLIISNAKKFVTETYDILSAIQDGNLAFSKAIDEFDIDRGCRLSTFATKVIRREIYRERTKNCGNIAVATNLQIEYKRYHNFVNRFFLMNGREPSLEEVANGMDILMERAVEIINIPLNLVSLNSPINDSDEESELVDVVVNESSLQPEIEFFRKNLKNDLEDAMKKNLNERESFVLTKQFNLDGMGEVSQKELAAILNVTSERVRQIRERALEKLRTKEKELKIHMTA